MKVPEAKPDRSLEISARAIDADLLTQSLRADQDQLGGSGTGLRARTDRDAAIQIDRH